MENISMNPHVREAQEAYNSNRMNCSQAVITAYSNELCIDADTARSLVWGLGGGIGGMQRTCGALTTMACVVGARCARAGFTKDAAYAKVREACEMFEERLGSMDCIVILEDRKPFPLCCPQVVETAADCIEAVSADIASSSET